MITDSSLVNWRELITEFLGNEMTIREFAKAKEVPERMFKYRLYKDPRYERKVYCKQPNAEGCGTVKLIPVTVDVPKSETVSINGFRIDISSSTGDEALAKVLSAIRRIS